MLRWVVWVISARKKCAKMGRKLQKSDGWTKPLRGRLAFGRFVVRKLWCCLLSRICSVLCSF